MLKLFSNRTQLSIMGKAKSLNLKSYFYLNRVYTTEDEDYLKNNYLNKNNEELAMDLNRNANGIAQHLWVMGLYRPHEKTVYNSLAEYIRKRLSYWVKQTKKNNNFTCSLTGVQSNIVVHHIHGFNLILNEAIKQINFPLYDDFNDYSNEQLDEVFLTFYSLQEARKSYTCLTEGVHKHFHSIYGYGNNTEEQWNEFVNRYYRQ